MPDEHLENSISNVYRQPSPTHVYGVRYERPLKPRWPSRRSEKRAASRRNKVETRYRSPAALLSIPRSFERTRRTGARGRNSSCLAVCVSSFRRAKAKARTVFTTRVLRFTTKAILGYDNRLHYLIGSPRIKVYFLSLLLGFRMESLLSFLFS